MCILFTGVYECVSACVCGGGEVTVCTFVYMVLCKTHPVSVLEVVV